VTVATRVARLGEQIAAEGFRLEPLRWIRGSINPLRLVADLWTIGRLYRRLKPDIIHHVSLKPIILGTAAARCVPGSVVVNALTGRGYVFTARALRARVLAPLVSLLLRGLLRRPNTVVLLENEDDRQFVVDTVGVAVERTAVNQGSGIDTDHFHVLAMPQTEPVAIGCAARMVGIKGIADLVAASRILRGRHVPHRLLLAGATDPESPDAIPDEVLREWARQDGVEWLGRIDDVRTLWRQCHIAALASQGGEGVPLSLVEAAACGRPLVATDVSGSRDIARVGINALLAPPHAPQLLADALERLIKDQAMRNGFAAESRRIAESTFSAGHVLAATLTLYDDLLNRPPTPASAK
jgi:glycosyltransferase involved in cell wall biosynthesis